jgi:hypothetical protein
MERYTISILVCGGQVVVIRGLTAAARALVRSVVDDSIFTEYRQ